MSQWTHVNASIRFDFLPGLEDITEKDLGKICRWEDGEYSHWDNSKLPCGTEGSIEYEIVKTGGENSMACRAVIFTGDLRGYEDKEEILSYFEDITKDKMVRSGVLEIEIEFQKIFVYRHVYKKGWILISEISNKGFEQC